MKNRITAIVTRFRAFDLSMQIRAILILAGMVLLAVLLFSKKPWSIEASPDRGLKISEYVTIYLWIALLVNLALVGMLAATTHWWARRAEPNAPALRPLFQAPRWFWPLVCGAMLLNAWLCWPRLWHSFWHDETYPIRNAIVGEYKKTEDGTLRLKKVKWTDTLFFYKKPNHTFYSGLARVLNDSWLAIARPAGLQFNEPLIRLPAYVAGIASIAAISMLLLEMNFSSAGVIAAYLSALHPWHLRYASEARAYALVFFLLPLVLVFFLRAVRSGAWRWWIAFGLAEFLLLYAYPTCLYVLLVLNLAAPFIILRQWGKTSAAVTQGMRWLVVNIFAAMLFLPLMLPCAPQFIKYSKATEGIGDLNAEWVGNFLSHLLAGISWEFKGYYEPRRTELLPWFTEHPGLGVLIAFAGLAFLVLGIRRMAGARFGYIALTLILPAALCFADTKARNGHIHIWYLIFLLPGALALVSLGLDDIFSAARTRMGKTAAAAFIVLMLGGYTAWTAPQRHNLLTHSLQPNRESVLLTRPTLDPFDPRQRDIITATFLGPPDPYDPNIILFRNAVELGDLAHRADSENKELFINIGYLTTVELEHFHKYEFLKKSGLFEEASLPIGFEPTMQNRIVFRYKRGSAANFDFSKVPHDRGREGSVYQY